MKLTFDDVLIEPQFSTIKSRKDVNLSVKIGNLILDIPIISSNMDTVTEDRMANVMYREGAIGCLHRFMSIEDNADMFVSSMQHDASNVIVSFGLGEIEQQRVNRLVEVGATSFCLDVAHGAQQVVAEQTIWFKQNYPEMTLIVGNFGSAKSLRGFLSHTMANKVIPDAVKVGIGPGSACTTRIVTGVGFPQISAIQAIKQSIENMPIKIIADGGMKTSGDIAKALAAGADAVMLGGMLAGTDETPGKILGGYSATDGTLIGSPPYKAYRGSASIASYSDQGKDWATAEGESFTVPYKGPVKDIINSIDGGLRSAFTYVGAKSMYEFHKRARLIKVSASTVIKNGAHGENSE